jgi:hypothetical protein
MAKAKAFLRKPTLLGVATPAPGSAPTPPPPSGRRERIVDGPLEWDVEGRRYRMTTVRPPSRRPPAR